jgi:putative DNA primase/helicase
MPKIPVPPRLLADDITPERTAGLLAENDERITIFSAEGGIFDILAGRYSNGVPNLDLFLKGHSGDSVRVDRKTGVPVILQNPAITMCLSPQPEVIRGLAQKPGFRGRGLLGRFLYYMPESRLGYRSIETTPVDRVISETYRRNIEALLEYQWDVNTYGEKLPHILKLSAEAFNNWKEFYGLAERELRDGGQFETMRDWAGKLPGAAARLAGIFHLMKHAGAAIIPLTVEAVEMDCALNMATLLSLHARAAFGLMGTDPEIEAAKHILAWIKRDRPDTFTGRDCHRAVRGRYPKMMQVLPGLTILEERGFIFSGNSEQSRLGRPKSPSYFVNPKVLEEAAA